jgi:hypothetical protein
MLKLSVLPAESCYSVTSTAFVHLARSCLRNIRIQVRTLSVALFLKLQRLLLWAGRWATHRNCGFTFDSPSEHFHDRIPELGFLELREQVTLGLTPSFLIPHILRPGTGPDVPRHITTHNYITDGEPKASVIQVAIPHHQWHASVELAVPGMAPEGRR